ncbi:MAG: hypothetical protein AB7O62_08685 [Pirellulales bacterium]
MRRHQQIIVRGKSRSPHQHAAQSPRAVARVARLSKRARIEPRSQRLPFVPPEDWHEPVEDGSAYRVIVQAAGEGFRHVVTPEEVRQRLAQLPPRYLANLEVVQFSRMTRKKQSFPCYGLQWGTTVYLYPIETNLIEYYPQPPKPSQLVEARMYGGRWEEYARGLWRLVWSEAAIKDFYLNNILIHELGHLHDDRNNRSVDRERYAEWFALEHGYRATQHLRQPAKKEVRRRHHAK